MSEGRVQGWYPVRCAFLLLFLYLLPFGCWAEVVELPRPNSGEFTFKQASARQQEFFTMAQSGKRLGWKNPYFGFAVHIDKEDQLWLYGSSVKVDTKSTQSIAEVKAYTEDMLSYVYGNPLGVLVTCEMDIRKSKQAAAVRALLFRPSVQVFYCQQAPQRVTE